MPRNARGQRSEGGGMSGLMHRSFVLLLALSGAASAQNLFWDPRFPGEGWAFENQDDVITVATLLRRGAL